jgi:hypothetical protein
MRDAREAETPTRTREHTDAATRQDTEPTTEGLVRGFFGEPLEEVPIKSTDCHKGGGLLVSVRYRVGFPPRCYKYKTCPECRLYKTHWLVQQIQWEDVHGWFVVDEEDWDTVRQRVWRRGGHRLLRIPRPRNKSLVITDYPDPGYYKLPVRLDDFLFRLLGEVPDGKRVRGTPTSHGDNEPWGGDYAGAWPKSKSSNSYLFDYRVSYDKLKNELRNVLRDNGLDPNLISDTETSKTLSFSGVPEDYVYQAMDLLGWHYPKGAERDKLEDRVVEGVTGDA